MMKDPATDVLTTIRFKGYLTVAEIAAAGGFVLSWITGSAWWSVWGSLSFALICVHIPFSMAEGIQMTHTVRRHTRPGQGARVTAYIGIMVIFNILVLIVGPIVAISIAGKYGHNWPAGIFWYAFVVSAITVCVLGGTFLDMILKPDVLAKDRLILRREWVTSMGSVSGLSKKEISRLFPELFAENSPPSPKKKKRST